MPVKYVGRTTNLLGKTLWEIVGNLKDFGIGRLVKRHAFERYPEPSFLRIIKVDAVKNEEPRKVRIWAEKVFRGQRYPKLVEVYSVSYKPDYRLVPRTEEKGLWDQVDATPKKVKLLPNYIDFPPLMKYLMLEEMARNGEDTSGELRLELKVNSGRDNFYRKISDGETPNEFSSGTSQPQLYTQ